MNKRLTIVVEFDENEKPIWIWDSHKDAVIINAVKVRAICDCEWPTLFEPNDDS